MLQRGVLYFIGVIFTMTQMIACDTSRGAGEGDNPLLELDAYGVAEGTPFGIVEFEKVRPEHYRAAFEIAFKEQKEQIEKIAQSTETPSFAAVVEPIDRVGVRLAALKDLFEMSEAAISDSLFRVVSAEIWPKITEAQDEVWMNEVLFRKVDSLYHNSAVKERLTEQQKRLLERMHTRFLRGGALHSPAQKSRLAQINAELATLNSKFATNLLAANEQFILDLGSNDLDGLPNDVRIAAREEARRRGLKNRWVFTLNPSSMIPFLTFSRNRGLREAIYKAYTTRGYDAQTESSNESSNEAVVAQITKLRQERARILGYKSHAEYVIAQQMARTPEQAYGLIEQIWEPALKVAQKEQKVIEKKLYHDESAKRADAVRLGLAAGEEPTFEPWDWWYCMEQVKKDDFGVGGDVVRPYFTVENVRRGAFTLANRLFGVAFRPITAPLYSPECLVYEVLDRDNSHIGVLYLDLYARPGKGQGAWCGNLREQSYTPDGIKITPVVAMVCNFPQPMEDVATQLSLEQVETFFHEFGHAMHFLFQDVKHRGLRSVEGDFVEYPSQLFENWAFTPELLRMYAVHCRTNRVITDLIIENIGNSIAFGRGFETARQSAAALLDLDLHTMTDGQELEALAAEEGVKAFEKRVIRARHGLSKSIDPKYWLANFPHLYIYDYSAGYYFYQWAEVLDKDTFEAFKSDYEGVFSRTLATKLRETILSRGGESDGATMYHNFRGAEPSREAIIRSLKFVEPEKK